ncbi:Fic/DOC family protein (plasmid) [Gordonia rubripertincta]|uniref:protein adenylyltransferase n=1 Tax=Gordonia rubripertincta TaxID=36822 RepID=A0AAW6R9H4_GORRU|nr:Fic family protein [Gordonia rubripertincta]MCZ4537472.1 Fic family protein [Gordonia terrae]MDG6782947.1 Fic family protein [Gordonia rubripertincta]
MTPRDPEAGQVPENLPGLTHAEDLRDYERRAAYLRVSELDQRPDLVTGDFDFPHLQALHAYILQDVYPWAGQPRRRGEETAAMGMMHCRAEFLDGELRRVFTAIDRRRPSPDDRDAAIATVADHWGELTGVHPFRDGNSRTQRVFFHRYLQSAGWDIDWRHVNASAVHAARHVAMATVDSSYLAETLRPGIDRLGHTPPGALSVTEGTRDERRSADIFAAMIDHKRRGGTAATFTLAAPRAEETDAQRAARIARRGISRRSPTSSAHAPSSSDDRRRGSGHVRGPESRER